jgi:hypothetical protein
LLKEHRPFCPYVVRSTVVPTLPTATEPAPTASQAQSTAGVLEGWRAVLTVVLRYGVGQRQRAAALRRRQSMDGVSGDGDSAMEVDGDAEISSVDGVEAMVANVKTRGGKDLLRYVKGLLG